MLFLGMQLCTNVSLAQNDFGIQVGATFLKASPQETNWYTPDSTFGLGTRMGIKFDLSLLTKHPPVGWSAIRSLSINYFPNTNDSVAVAGTTGCCSRDSIRGIRTLNAFQISYVQSYEIGDFDEFLMLHVGWGIGFQQQNYRFEFADVDVSTVEFDDYTFRSGLIFSQNYFTFRLVAGAHYEFERFRVYAEVGAQGRNPVAFIANAGIFYPLVRFSK
jgi:hypothetical protein